MIARSIARRISSAGLVGLLEGLADDLLGDPLVLEVELDAGDAALGAGDLEVHVAEVVLVADDVGQQDCRPVASSWTRPIEMPPTGSVMGTPASIRLSVAPQTEAIELEPLDSRMSETTRIV